MTIVYLDTCFCIIEYPAMVFHERCKTHRTPLEAFTHNRSFNLRHGRNPTDLQRRALVLEKLLEKKKPQFQRR